MATSKIIILPVKAPITPKAKKRPHNMRSDGLRRVRLDIGTDPETGNRIRKYFYGHTLAEAESMKEKYIAEMEASRDMNNAVAPKPKYTVAEWVDRWQAAYGNTGGHSNRANIDNCCKKIIDALGPKRLEDVLPADIAEFARSCSHYSYSVVHKVRLTLQRVFDQALENGLIERVPYKKIKWENQGEGTHRYLAEWEIAHIVAHWQEHRVGVWAMIMLFAGLRRGEMMALTWEDIDLEAGVIHVRRGVHFEVNTPVFGLPKTKYSIRDVPIFTPLRAVFEALPLPHPSPLLCTTTDFRALTETAFVNGWTSYLKMMTQLLVPAPGQPITEFSIRTHDLRHSFCSMLFDAGVDVKTAQKLMGHASPEVTMSVYTHLSDAKKASSVDKMQAFTTKFAAPLLPPLLPP